MVNLFIILLIHSPNYATFHSVPSTNFACFANFKSNPRNYKLLCLTSIIIMLLPTTEDDILGCSSLVQNYRISNTSALAHCPRSQNVGHNKFQLVYTYFYKHLKIITLTFSLCSAHSRAQTPVPVRVQVHVHVQGLPSSVSVCGA